MKKTLLAFLISIPAFMLNAQEKTGWKQEHHEKIRSMKIAYFTERLEFTPEEAEKFWPVYNEYEKKKAGLHGERRKNFRRFGSEMETLTDEQAREMLDQFVEFHRKETELAVSFHEQIKEILPPKKIIKLYITEVQFREHMLRQLRGERYGPGGKRDKPHP